MARNTLTRCKLVVLMARNTLTRCKLEVLDRRTLQQYSTSCSTSGTCSRTVSQYYLNKCFREIRKRTLENVRKWKTSVNRPNISNHVSKKRLSEAIHILLSISFRDNTNNVVTFQGYEEKYKPIIRVTEEDVIEEHKNFSLESSRILFSSAQSPNKTENSTTIRKYRDQEDIDKP